MKITLIILTSLMLVITTISKLNAQNNTLVFESNAALNLGIFRMLPTNLIFSATDEEMIKQYPRLCFIDGKCVAMQDIILYMHEHAK